MKYGRKNEVKLNPLAYNIGLIGESGIGKTTIIKEYCEKVAGEDGYIFLEMGKEDGADAIQNINYLTCPTWEADYNENNNSIGFIDFVEDVVNNRTTDWKDLKVVVIDTYDELFAIAEPEVIAMHNRENPEKRVKSIKAAFGGFQAGEDKTIEIVLDALWSLKSVGVSFIIIGHTKNKNVNDPVTGEDFVQLTTNLSQKYFNAIKTKVHFLGVAAVDREIVKEKTGKKDMVTKKDITRGVVKSETRKITFRDDNFVIDSKSRFADVIESIPMEVDAFYNAIVDAIKAEHQKSGKTIEQSKSEQEEAEALRLKEIAQKENENKAKAELESILNEITDFIKNNKSNIDLIKPLMAKTKELGYSNPTTITNIEDAKIILAMI